MIVTPADFSPLASAVDHPAPVTFVFRGDAILVREGGGIAFGPPYNAPFSVR